MPSLNETAILVAREITVSVLAHMDHFGFSVNPAAIGQNAGTIFEEIFKKVEPLVK